MEFYERMRELRKEHGETQAQVAAAAGMTDRQYQRFETGKQKPGFDSLLALADHFGNSLATMDPADQTVFICHGDCLDDAEYTAEQIRALVPVKDIIINYVGPVIGAHAGPGVLALFYVGVER